MATKRNTKTTTVSQEETSCETVSTKSVSTETLYDSDEIEVLSIVPNVNYFDKKTGDRYVWENSGDIETLTVETLKNMYRNHRGYFTDGFLKPLDSRVVSLFKLDKMYKNYEFITNSKNYTKDNIDEICEIISKSSNGFKSTICSYIKNAIVEGELQNIGIIKRLEKLMDVDFISFFDDRM